MTAKHGNELVNGILVLSGALLAGMGIHGFLMSSNFIDGGVTGVSMLLSQTTGLSLSLLLPLVNLPFIVVGYRLLGKRFAVRSIFGIATLAAALKLIPYPDVTHELVLTAVFGGFFIGAGIGLAIRGGAVLDGTEIAALLISKRVHALKVGDVILGFNVILFLAAMATLGVDSSLYSILTYVSAAKTLDFVLHGIDEYTAVNIISSQSAEIRERIMEDLGRGLTVYRGMGGKSGAEQNVLQCIVTRLEIGNVKDIVRELDPSAFIFYHPLTGAEGGMVKSRGFH